MYRFQVGNHVQTSVFGAHLDISSLSRDCQLPVDRFWTQLSATLPGDTLPGDTLPGSPTG